MKRSTDYLAYRLQSTTPRFSLKLTKLIYLSFESFYCDIKVYESWYIAYVATSDCKRETTINENAYQQIK